MINFGWCYFKMGARGHHGKYHYLNLDKWKSLCGHWEVRLEERKYINFRPKNELRQTKICRNCERFGAKL